MQKIINGKMYDTETAKEIAVNDIHDIYESFHIYEHLYRKKTGEYFLERDIFGDGSAMEEYYWVLEHRFEPLSIEETKKWMESYCDAEVYIEEFGEPEE